MVDVHTLRTIVGLIGNVISLCLFLSPIPTFLKIIKQKSTSGFKPDPYVATILNCMLWVFYGLPIVHPDSTLVVTINGAGLVIESIYVFIFITYCLPAIRRKILIAVVIEFIFVGLVIFVTLYGFHTTTKRSMIVGLLCIVFNIFMYASPLTVMKLVIQTKSVKYMPLPLALANLCNGIVWVLYAMFNFDPYILVPNGLGTLSGVIQIVLYATYYKTTNWDEDDTTNRKKRNSEVQLSPIA